MDAGLAELAALGPYFALERVPDRRGEWRPLADLLEPGALEDRVAATRIAWGAPGEVDERVAASTVALGLFSRLLSPVMAASALGTKAAPLGLTTTWWRPFSTGPWPLAVAHARTEDARTARAMTAIETTVRDTIGPLIDRFATEYALSPKVLWGNAASAAFGVVAALHTMRPDLARAAAPLAVALLESEPLREHGDLIHGRFVRRSCCLFYRAPSGGYCGDCVLALHNRP